MGRLCVWSLVCDIFSCSIQLSMTFILFINVNMPTIAFLYYTIVAILTCINMIIKTSEGLKARKVFKYLALSFYGQIRILLKMVNL